MHTAKKKKTINESSNKGIEKQETRQIPNKEQNGSSSFFSVNLNVNRLKSQI